MSFVLKGEGNFSHSGFVRKGEQGLGFEDREGKKEGALQIREGENTPKRKPFLLTPTKGGRVIISILRKRKT